MQKIQELRKICFNGKFSNKGDILNVLESEYFKSVSDELKYYIIKPKFKMAFEKDEVSSYELLLVHLDIFIGYIKDHIWLNTQELRVFLDMCLKSNNIKTFLLAKESFHDNNSFKFEEYFWKAIDDINLNNYNIIYNKLGLSNLFNKLEFNPNDYSLDNKEDLYNIFKFICGVFNCNKSNNLNMFADLSTLEDKQMDFYSTMWQAYLENYIDKKKYYEKFL